MTFESFHVFYVGGLFDPNTTRWEDGVEYNYAANQHIIKLIWSRLKEPEVTAVDHGPLQFALYAKDEQIILFLKLGTASHWLELPYTIWRVPVEDRTIPAPAAPDDHAAIMIILVQAETGRIAALRLLTISPAMTTTLMAAIRRQASLNFDQARYDEQLDALREHYPTPDDFVADPEQTILQCEGGD
jgi:hypothetical protein